MTNGEVQAAPGQGRIRHSKFLCSGVLFASGYARVRTLTQRARVLGWVVSALILLSAIAWPGQARGAQRPVSPEPARPEAGIALPPVEPAELQLWGTVRAVLGRTSLVVVTSDLVRFEVRLLGVEPPEVPRMARSGAQATPGQPFGEEVTTYVRDLLVDKQVRLEPYGKDQSGRTLAVVWLGDINVNLTLVKEGFAWVDPNVTISKVRSGLEVAERQAQVGKYGFWALPNPEPPWEFRKRHRLPAE